MLYEIAADGSTIQCPNVLILILMEYALRENLLKNTEHEGSLNPYSNGICSTRIKSREYKSVDELS